MQPDEKSYADFLYAALSWILAAAFFVGTLAYSGSFDHGYYAAKQLVFLFASGLAACGFGLVLLRRNARSFAWRSEHASAILLLLWCCLSVTWAHSSYFLWKDGPLYLGAFLLFLLLSDDGFNERHFRRILVAFYLAALIHSGIGCAQAISGLDFISQSGPPAGLFGNRNFGSQVAFTAAPIGFFLLLTSQRRRHIFGAGASLGILLAYTVFTTTRSVWLASLLGSPLLIFAVYLVFRDRQSNGFLRERLAGSALMFGLILILIVPPYPGQGSRELLAQDKFERSQHALAESFGEEGLGVDPAMENRLTMWNNSLAAFLERPFTGHGFGTWEAVYYEYAQSRVPDFKIRPGYTYHHAHNFYVEQLVNLGAIGLLLFFATGWIVLRRALVSFLSPETSSDSRVLLLMLAYGALVILVTAFFSMPLDYPVLPSVLAVFAARVARGNSTAVMQLPTRWAWTQRPLIRYLWTALFLVGGAVCLVHATRERTLQLALNECQQYYYAGDYAEARIHAQRVLAIDPHHVVTNNRLAMMDIRKHPDVWLPPIQRIEAAYPMRPSNLALLALNHTRRGDLEGALTYWNRLLEICPQNERALKEAVGAAFKNDHIDEAIRYCETLVQAYPDDESYQRTLENLKNSAVSSPPEAD